MIHGEGSGRLGAALRWAAAALVVAGLHAGAGWWVLRHPIAQATPPEAPPGILIDLEPIAAAQNGPTDSTTLAAGAAPTPQAAAEPAPEPPPEPPAAMPVPEPPPEPVPPPEPPPPAPQPEPPPPQPEPPPEPPRVEEPPPPTVVAPEPASPVTAPPIVPEARSDAVLAPPPPPRPAPRPKPRPAPPPQPDPRALAREAAARQAAAARQEQRRVAHAQARAERPRRRAGETAEAAAPRAASSGASVATWRGAVIAHLNAFKPAAPGGASGTARVSFSVDRSGRVLGASLAGSSGDAALDAAAVAMVRRASPLPAPPPELGGRINLSVPVRFH